MKRLSVLLVLVLSLTAALAQTADDQYVQIYATLQVADSLYQNARSSDALARYLQVQAALQGFQKGYPDWNPSIVRFRLSYLAGRIEELKGKLPGGASAPGVEATAAPAPDPAQLQQQLGVLSEQVRQLQADKSVLEAKLREALAVQPAAIDPRELARAEERTKALQKENDLLQVALAQEKAKPASADPKALEEAKATLAEANRKLALESDRTATLEMEKKALQTRVETLGTNATAAAALKTENELLKKQVATTAASHLASAGTAADLAQARNQVAALQSDKEMLRLEKVALETRVKQLQASEPKEVITSLSASSKAETKRIRQLESERDELQKKLESANKRLASASRKKGAGSQLQQLENEVAGMRSQLSVLEAQKIPYTPEELALFKAAPTELTTVEARKPVSQLPEGSAELVAEAQRYFSARQFDKAEEKYLEVLKKDNKNPLTLANLAAIELQMSRLPEAERNATKALEQAPDDAYSLYILGQVKFRQKQFDAALEALSRAAKLDPNNAPLQNSLGLVLSEKGMRGPAETALRKAIQIQPGYGEAHNNLAVVYLTQQPPLIELARWHYQKAVAAGSPNPKLQQMLEAAEKNASK